MLIYWLIVVLIVLNIIDLIQTKIIFNNYGTDGEFNPIVNLIYVRLGFFGIILYKVILIGFAITMCYMIESIFVTLILIGVYIFAVIHNWRTARFNAN
jgi:hypothetical protein